jgi:branched-chain amino acid transport system permease protein
MPPQSDLLSIQQEASMLFILEDTINGILMGSIYGLAALGLTLIFGVMKVINFAHGSLLMVGMYVAYWAVILTGLHPYLTLVIVVPVMFLFGYLLQDILIKPIFKAEKDVREPITVIIVTTGLWYILDNLSLLIFGPQYRNLPDNPLRGKMLEFGDMMISVPKLWGSAPPSSPPGWSIVPAEDAHGPGGAGTSLDRTRPVCRASTSTRFTTSPSASAQP